MSVHEDSNPVAWDDTAPAAPNERRRAWKAPSVTAVDLAEVTLAMGPGATDAGFLS